MSTKVYDAYLLKDSRDLWKFVEHCQVSGYHFVTKTLAKMHHEFMGCEWKPEAIAEKTEYYSFLKKSMTDEQIALVVKSSLAANLMEQGYKEQVTKMVWNGFNYTVDITFRYLRGSIYVQFFADAELCKALDPLRKDRRIRDYHYQNQTDMPDGMDEKEWEKRRKVWDALYDTEDARRTYLTLSLMSFSEFQRWKYGWERKVGEMIREGKTTW